MVHWHSESQSTLVQAKTATNWFPPGVYELSHRSSQDCVEQSATQEAADSHELLPMQVVTEEQQFLPMQRAQALVSPASAGHSCFGPSLAHPTMQISDVHSSKQALFQMRWLFVVFMASILLLEFRFVSLSGGVRLQVPCRKQERLGGR